MEHMEKLLTLGLANAAAAAVLAIGVACMGRVLARRPAWLHCLWLLVLLKLLTPPLFEIPILGRAFPGTTREPVSIAVEPADLDGNVNLEALAEVDSERLAALDDPATAEHTASSAAQKSSAGLWRELLVPRIALVWILGTIATLALAALRISRFRRVLRQARPADSGVQDQVVELCKRLGLGRPPSVWMIDAPLMPMVWAVGCHPQLIVPRKLWKTLSQRQRSLLLAHELAHLCRGDHFVRLFELVVTALFWWLPVVWWARYALRDAEEECCDAWVVWAFPEEVRTYAETLLDTVDFLNPSRSSEPLLACGFGGTQHLRRRLTMIMLGTTPRRLGKGSALLAFALSALLLPLSPSWAQKPDDEKPGGTQELAIELTDDNVAQPADAKSEVHVVVATGDNVQEVKADSLQKAEQLIKQKIEALAKEGGDAKSNADQIRALKQALINLGMADHKAITLKLNLDNALSNTRPHDTDPKITAETKAKIDGARARVQALRNELDEKRHQLQKAEQDLAKLSAEARVRARTIVREIRIAKPVAEAVRQRVVVKPVKPSDATPEVKELHNAEKAPKTQARAFAFTVPDTGLNPSDRKRLESLERKLEKLLEEVASLKKHDENPK
jgi:beta-lactamase regulating signal transducer with metallopeptidase domain